MVVTFSFDKYEWFSYNLKVQLIPGLTYTFIPYWSEDFESTTIQATAYPLIVSRLSFPTRSGSIRVFPHLHIRGILIQHARVNCGSSTILVTMWPFAQADRLNGHVQWLVSKY